MSLMRWAKARWKSGGNLTMAWTARITSDSVVNGMEPLIMHSVAPPKKSSSQTPYTARSRFSWLNFKPSIRCPVSKDEIVLTPMPDFCAAWSWVRPFIFRNSRSFRTKSTSGLLLRAVRLPLQIGQAELGFEFLHGALGPLAKCLAFHLRELEHLPELQFQLLHRPELHYVGR